ncbi:MAG: M1 family metallopeptidase [Bacteroidota bacterium]|nr:M1 family metallopeptidase [Bacteroidota bacterium]
MIVRLVLFFLLLQSVATAQETDVLHYRFALNLHDAHDTITGLASIQFVHRSDKREISFDLVGRQSDGKGMQVLWATKEGLADNVGLAVKQIGDKFFVTFPAARKGDTTSLLVHYKGIPADGLIISKNKFGERTFFADNWPNRAHHWIPCTDRPDDKASFEFLVTAPKQYKVVSNGLKIAEKAVGPATTLTHWKEATPQATKVMVIGVARFAVKEYTQQPGGVSISAWVYQRDSTKGFYDYGLTPEILQFFADYIGPFPYQKLANVQSTTIFGGMENASAIFYAESSVTGNRNQEDLMAHEIAHQWFGDAVSEKSFAHLWLSEGFADFLTNYYFEKKYGKAVAAERWKKSREEVVGFAGHSPHPVVDSTTDLMSLLNPNSYNKGAWVLHMLRSEVGDQTFQKVIQTYYQQYKGSNAETSDLKTIAEKVSGRELTPFFEQWLHRPGVPQLQVSTKVQDGELTVFVKQHGKPYRLTLEADIIQADSEVVRKQFNLKDVNQVFKIPVKGSAVTLALDPDVKLLYTIK